MNANDTPAWKPRPFGESDDEKVAALYESVHEGRAFNAPEWRWQFGEAVSDGGFIWVADDAGTLAGQYATVPVRMQVGKGTVRTALSLDTMTHPRYRKQGIFIALAKAVYEEIRSKDVKLVYGFPNENSIHGFLKHLDFFVLEDIPALMRPLDASRLIGKKIRSGILSKVLGTPVQAVFDLIFAGRKRGEGIRVESPPAFPEEVDNLFARLSGSFTNLVVRDHRYLRWRYDLNPRHSYERFLGYRDGVLAGYCVCSVTERDGLTIGLIVDLLAPPRDHELVGLLVRKAYERFRTLGVSAAACMLTSRSPFAGMLKRLGFLFPLRRFPYILRLNTDDVDPKAIRNVANWHITFGDGDFV
jgi:GNAT superfamily N-acetyltransferase